MDILDEAQEKLTRIQQQRQRQLEAAYADAVSVIGQLSPLLLKGQKNQKLKCISLIYDYIKTIDSMLNSSSFPEEFHDTSPSIPGVDDYHEEFIEEEMHITPVKFYIQGNMQCKPPNSPLLTEYVKLYGKYQDQSIEPFEKDRLSNIVRQMVYAEMHGDIRAFRAEYIAAQLTIVEYRLWINIPTDEFLGHKPPYIVSPALSESSQFFNYLTRIIEVSILEPNNAESRALVIHRWLKVGHFLKILHNYQTLKAVLSSLGTPPIARLKNTWKSVTKADKALLKSLNELVSENHNFKIYRHLISSLSCSTPIIPYIGLFIHDITYLKSIAAKNGLNPRDDPKVLEILTEIDRLKSFAPYPCNLMTMLPRSKYDFLAKRTAIRESFAPELYEFSKEFTEEEVECFLNHWILSRSWISESQIDRLSLSTEPKQHKSDEEISLASNMNDISFVLLYDEISDQPLNWLQENNIDSSLINLEPELPKKKVDSFFVSTRNSLFGKRTSVSAHSGTSPRSSTTLRRSKSAKRGDTKTNLFSSNPFADQKKSPGQNQTLLPISTKEQDSEINSL